MYYLPCSADINRNPRLVVLNNIAIFFLSPTKMGYETESFLFDSGHKALLLLREKISVDHSFQALSNPYNCVCINKDEKLDLRVQPRVFGFTILGGSSSLEKSVAVVRIN